MTDGLWRVLVADDDPTVGILTQAALGSERFVVTAVASGEAALGALQRAGFDIALLDVEMGEPDGFAVCAALRRRFGPDFPVVLMTGRNDAECARRAAATGAALVIKPINWRALAGQLANRLAMAKDADSDRSGGRGADD